MTQVQNKFLKNKFLNSLINSSELIFSMEPLASFDGISFLAASMFAY